MDIYKDSLTGETLIGANITKGEGEVLPTNQYGFYSINFSGGNYQLLVSFVGYDAKLVDVAFNENRTLNILVSPSSTNLNSVTVTGGKESNIKSAQMGKIDLSINAIKSLPPFFGEVDILKRCNYCPVCETQERVILAFMFVAEALIKILSCLMRPLFTIRGICSVFLSSIQMQLKSYPYYGKLEFLLNMVAGCLR